MSIGARALGLDCFSHPIEIYGLQYENESAREELRARGRPPRAHAVLYHPRFRDLVKRSQEAIDSQIDRNLDTISSMLGNLKEISLEQANAMDVQNAKLDNMEVSVDSATTRIDRLNYKGNKILRR